MSAILHLHKNSSPSGPKEIHEMSAKHGAYTLPVPIDRLRDWTRYAERALQRGGEAYSIEAAIVDLFFDIDKTGEPRSKTDYAERWGWGYKQVRNRWNLILSAVDEWQTAFGRLRSKNEGQKGATEGQRRGNDSGDSGPKLKSRGNGGATEGQKETPDTLYISNYNSQQKNDSHSEEGEKPERSEPSDPISPPVDLIREEAAAIWKVYPKKVGKAAALKKLESLLKKKAVPEHFGSIREAVEEYARSRADQPPRFTLNPQTFFNGRYDDDPSVWWGNREESRPDPDAPINHAAYCDLHPSRKDHREIHRTGDPRLYYIPRRASLPSGWSEGPPTEINA